MHAHIYQNKKKFSPTQIPLSLSFQSVHVDQNKTKIPQPQFLSLFPFQANT